MRKIKFRAWDEPSQSFVEDAMPHKARHFEQPLMQYTGLNDKNGKEIFEGDLIECTYCKKEYGEVWWNRGMVRFDLKWKDKDCGNAHCNRIDHWATVIGNIYQNPELLNA